MTNDSPSYHGYRFPSEIISHAVWLYHRFGLSLREEGGHIVVPEAGARTQGHGFGFP